jgi:putative membrane protein
MMGHDHGWDAGDWSLMGLLMVLFWGALIFGGVLLFSRIRVAQHPGPGAAALPPVPGGARQLLDDRLARGEIDVEEYRVRRDALDGR